MPDITAEFFNRIDKRGQVPFLRNVSGTLRFDLVDDNNKIHPWYVTITKGDVEVSNDSTEADVVTRLHQTTFEGIAAGQVNAMAAVLRGVMTASGNLGLLIAFSRFFPGPAASRAATATAGSSRRES